jgi:hypothetical protein
MATKTSKVNPDITENVFYNGNLFTPRELGINQHGLPYFKVGPSSHQFSIVNNELICFIDSAVYYLNYDRTIDIDYFKDVTEEYFCSGFFSKKHYIQNIDEEYTAYREVGGNIDATLADLNMEGPYNLSLKELYSALSDYAYSFKYSTFKEYAKKYKTVELSFSCLAMLLDQDIQNIHKILKKTEILDLHESSWLNLNNTEKIALRKSYKDGNIVKFSDIRLEAHRIFKSKIRKGYNFNSYHSNETISSKQLDQRLVSDQWHRPQSVLLRIKNKSKWDYIFFGQDEEQYFACLLPKSAKTITEAYKVLEPEYADTPGTLRQGEWFAIPIDDELVPEPSECAFTFMPSELDRQHLDAAYTGLALPVKDNDSARHIIQYIKGADKQELRVDHDHYIYVKGCTLVHSRAEHDILVMDPSKWYYFAENTALKSVGMGTSVD